ncbi:hypothetical protein V6Z11_D10G076700 [Gossypium hirsutum]
MPTLGCLACLLGAGMLLRTWAAAGQACWSQSERCRCPCSSSVVVAPPPFFVLFFEIVGFYPEGNPSRNSQRPGQNPGLRGGLEIVFNQQ